MNTTQGGDASFSVLDPRVPMLAAKAALQLDRCIIDRTHSGSPGEKDLAAVRELGSMLRSATGPAVGPSAKGLIDPASIAALSQAIVRYDSSFNESSDKFAAGLRSVVEQLTVERLAVCDTSILAAVRDFFVVLSNLAATSQQSRYRLRPASPFRK